MKCNVEQELGRLREALELKSTENLDDLEILQIGNILEKAIETINDL